MTHDHKAPLPDASHDAYVRLMAAARLSKPHNGYGEADIVSDELTLRSHIAALEHKHDDLVTRCVQAESDRDALEEQINLMSKHQAGVDEKLCELEAKNKRLVEVLRIYANPDNFFNSNGQCYEFDCVSPDVTEEPKYLGATARHILAQTGEKS